MDKISYETYQKVSAIQDQLQIAYDQTKNVTLLFAKADLCGVVALWLLDDCVDFEDAVRRGVAKV